MSKERSILGFMLFLWAFRTPPRARVRRLSDDERQLVEHYRSLSAEDRNALHCLLNAMGSVSRF
ncbi:hypothetical protein CCU68_07575 [Pseudomonas gingeri NCPPB 3146 = LMG 5327]|uniref:Uncharacterized protein n=2 Tax=Pseudomonas gingeri TaxID=117681 RepID=A0A7Y7XZP0_9PSED|nr:hypothetical protein [Pseudomonas gingeri]NVZ27333.1 hypothetical protein [Pseudomonas gingeri]NVZ63880.1 hypothetical protein [Pseudomonas gingeri]NVZ77974.1 hypothetical protein [Pseudomonas gingeri]NWC15035.1 hypothetical protein [Pseudomonas gingeri]NWE49375.1 hypothetical protein [Pseudomonas gingeri]